MLTSVSNWFEDQGFHNKIVIITSSISSILLVVSFFISVLLTPSIPMLVLNLLIMVVLAISISSFLAKKISTNSGQSSESLDDKIENYRNIDDWSDFNFENEALQLPDSVILLLNDIKSLKNTIKENQNEFDERFDEAIDMATSQQEYLTENVDLIVDIINKFADGELNVKLDENREDEIGKLFLGFNTAIANVRKIIEKVSGVIIQAAESSLEISTSTEQLAATANQQTEQAVDIAIAMEEMSHTANETSENTINTLETAKKSGKIAKSGEMVVSTTVEKIQDLAKVVKESSKAISNLSRSSSEIGNIISVINSIAEQTNLLALNAAIEAARAGEEGRGFAVVADEVRKLAERTRMATKQISGMIEDIQVEMTSAVDIINNGTSVVDETIHLADDAGKSLKDILTVTKDLISFVNQISNANSEQTGTATEIAKNIEHISNISRESATAISFIATSSTKLSELNDELSDMIKFFKF